MECLYTNSMHKMLSVYCCDPCIHRIAPILGRATAVQDNELGLARAHLDLSDPKPAELLRALEIRVAQARKPLEELRKASAQKFRQVPAWNHMEPHIHR